MSAAPLPVPTPPMAAALDGLARVVDAPHADPLAASNWRWVVRQRMSAVRDALAGEADRSTDGWLAARADGVVRERTVLLGRIGVLATRVLEAPDTDTVRGELRRLLADVSHHLQRLHDLAYDEVELELGGSE